MWPFTKRRKISAETPGSGRETGPSADQLLLATLLESERERISKTAEIEIHRMQLEAKRYELELAELERRGEEKRKQLVFDEKLKEQRRESMARARAKKNQQHAQPQIPLATDCEECNAALQNRSPVHASDLIRHATENHAARFRN